MADQIEQYKSYFQDVASVRRRHVHSRHFYLAMVSAMFVFVCLAGNQGAVAGEHGLVLILTGLVGGLLCFLWNTDMHAYHAIFKAKNDILRRIEGHHNLFNIYEEEHYFKHEGAGYQRRMNAVLRSYMEQKSKAPPRKKKRA